MEHDPWLIGLKAGLLLLLLGLAVLAGPWWPARPPESSPAGPPVESGGAAGSHQCDMADSAASNVKRVLVNFALLVALAAAVGLGLLMAVGSPVGP